MIMGLSTGVVALLLSAYSSTASLTRSSVETARLRTVATETAEPMSGLDLPEEVAWRWPPWSWSSERETPLETVVEADGESKVAWRWPPWRSSLERESPLEPATATESGPAKDMLVIAAAGHE
jgi:hypothetical protein